MSVFSPRLGVETLEARDVPAVFGTPWPDGQHLTLSFAPDGTAVGDTGSNLAAMLSALGPNARRDALRAFQTWAVQANVNIGLVGDNGAVFGAGGEVQGDARFGDIDQYNVKGTTNIYFDTGKWALSRDEEQQLCAAAEQAKAMDNALLLVVGYTDAVGSEDYNQVLSERRAAKVVNHLQQKCGWAPYRMLTPTGMAEADPAADNNTAEGKAQNRRVAVNILVSKAVEEREGG